MLAVGAVALALLLVGDPAAAPASDASPVGPPDETPGVAAAASQDPAMAPDTVTPADTTTQVEPAGEDTAGSTIPADPGESARQATGTLRELGRGLYNSLPAIGIALGLILVAAVLAKLVRVALRSVLASWERAEAMSALVAILIWLLALGAALSILAGDARALVGSVGLFGLALSWALQTPIESFTGWLLNSFRSYYRIGDRIAVGDVFGDVARIDFLTTTVFEAGGPDKRVEAAQSTGALITFPNFEVLRSNIVNFTRDFPYVWDELTVGVANESDIAAAVQVLERTAYEIVGQRMEDAAAEYGVMLERARLGWDVATRPEVYVAARESWTDLTIRYLVPAREMRRWSSKLQMAVNRALSDGELVGRIRPAYPRTQIQRIPPPRWAQSDDQGAEVEDPR